MKRMDEQTGQWIFFAANVVHLFCWIYLSTMNQNRHTLDERIKIEIRNGSRRCSPLINDRVPDDVMKCFEHLPNLKKVEPYIDGFSICTFDSKINFE